MNSTDPAALVGLSRLLEVAVNQQDWHYVLNLTNRIGARLNDITALAVAELGKETQNEKI